MTYQSIVKHFLTEGDKVIIARVSPLADQGGYAVAVNYGLISISLVMLAIADGVQIGSLVARIGFQPVEEILRVYFSKTLSAGSSSNTEDIRILEEASRVLMGVINVQLALSLIILTFGPPYLPMVLGLLLPQRYLQTSAPDVLGAWIWYIPVLAINGGLEAFLSSVATSDELRKQSRQVTSVPLCTKRHS
jgi:oligosaccharide translocation protein RFT1